MKKLVRLYITRHGETEYNIEHRAQGWSDSPLTPYGREIAVRLGAGLCDVTFDAIYSSSSGRAADTARIVQDSMGSSLPIHLYDNLKERGLGKLEGRILSGGSWEQARAAAEAAGHKDKLDLDILSESYENIMPLGEPFVNPPYDLEDFDKFKTRLKKALDDICDKAKDGESNVFVVSHGLSILALMYALTGDKYGIGFIKNASITLVEYIDGAYYIKKVNDTSYIEEAL